MTEASPIVLRPDLCVIGAGSAGLSVAAAAAAFGVPVVLIERDRMGGDCLNVGCVPSKALIAAGERAAAMRGAAAFGIAPVEPRIDWAGVRRHVEGVIAAIAPNDSVERFSALGVQVIKGEARFRDRGTIVVGNHTIKARRFVVATGSRPAVPPIPGLADLPFLTNETIFALDVRPKHLIVLGGGPIGIEIAQAMRRLGAAVTIVEAATVLGREDAEAAALVRRTLLSEGVVLREGARVERAESAVSGLRLLIEGGEPVAGSHLMVATGRVPTVAGLELDLAGIEADASGIIVDRGLRTANRRVFAIGDCAGGAAGGQRFTHAANHHAGLILRAALFRLPVRVDAAAVPRVTYCDPEVASVGLSETEARESGAIRVLRWPFAENDRAQAEHRVEGLIKLVTDARGRILGVTIAGPRAGELIAPWVMAVQKRMAAKDMAGIIFAYPTFSEVSRRAAMSYYTPLAAKPGIRRLIGFLRRFG